MSRAIFAKPNIPKLKAKGYSCIDMHCHSRYSDALQTVESIYKKCKKLGIGISVADHNEIKGALKISKYKSFLSIPAIETTTSEGIHTLFYFYNPKELEEFYKKVVEKNRSKDNPLSDLKISLIDIAEKSKKYNCLISSSHPFGPYNTGVYKFTKKKEYRNLMKKIDFIEAINGSAFRSLNEKAIAWAGKLNKNFTGGSDAHTLGGVGCVVTAVKNSNSREDFLNGLKKNSLVVGEEIHGLLLSARYLLKLRMFSRFPKFYIKKLMRETLAPP